MKNKKKPKLIVSGLSMFERHWRILDEEAAKNEKSRSMIAREIIDEWAEFKKQNGKQDTQNG